MPAIASLRKAGARNESLGIWAMLLEGPAPALIQARIASSETRL